MALHNILVRAHPDADWEVLADPYSYSDWVLGTKEIGSADPDWPAVGSAFGYVAGLGPFRFASRTVVREVDRARRLDMEADARILTARVAISVREWGEGCLVVLEEHWIRGPQLLPGNPIIDLALSIRNRMMVRNLAALVERRRDCH